MIPRLHSLPPGDGLYLDFAAELAVRGFAGEISHAYATGPIGSYASGRLYPASRLIKIPEAMTAEDAAAVLFKGIAACTVIIAKEQPLACQLTFRGFNQTHPLCLSAKI